MPVHVEVATESLRSPVRRDRLARLAQRVLRAEGIRDAHVSITLVGDAAIARLNRTHLLHAGPTDVITFRLPSATGGVLSGDVYIGLDEARRNARAHGVGVREEVIRLVVHGALHVAGHDHPEGEGRLASPMWRRQESHVRHEMARA